LVGMSTYMTVGKNWVSLVILFISLASSAFVNGKAYLRNFTKKLPAPSRGPLGFRKRPTTIVEKRTSWIATLHANLNVSETGRHHKY
jgi:hypothetical protein